jgi:phthalate 4,5-cis-dihydrodiol dehydrogenase
VRAQTFDWLPERPTVGAHAAWLEFDGGVLATAVYNGYGHLLSPEFTFGIGEWGLPVATAAPPAATATTPPVNAPLDEAAAKRARARHAIPDLAPHPPFFGLTLVSCERGEIRQSPAGLWVADAAGRREMVLPVDRSPREAVLDEFHAAITGLAAALHDGRWGLATLEVCLAAHNASRTGRAERLREQVATR